MSRPSLQRARPWIAFLVLLLLGLALLIAQWWFWWCRPVGSGPVHIPVDLAKFQQPWTERPVFLVGLGDSVTAGFGADPGHSYFRRLASAPADEFPELYGAHLSNVLPSLSVTNLAVSGSTSLQHARQQIPNVPMQDPGVLGLVMMTTGGNDLLHHYGRTAPVEGAMYGATFEQAEPWARAFEKRLADMIGVVTNRFPGGCHVFLGTIYDPTDGIGDLQKAAELPPWRQGLGLLARHNEILRRFAIRNPNVHLVDVHQAFLGHGIHCSQFWRPFYDRSDPHYWYHDNLEDPNDRGYDALRRLFLNAIAQVLTRPVKPNSAILTTDEHRSIEPLGMVSSDTDGVSLLNRNRSTHPSRYLCSSVSICGFHLLQLPGLGCDQGLGI